MAHPRIFIRYSHKDREWLERLRAQLAVLEQERLVAAWSDENIPQGEDWPQAIREALDAADIAVLLVSANFLSSQFIREKELPAMLERRRSRTLCVLPLVVTPCAWQLSPHLRGIEARPKHRDSVARGTPAEQEGDLRDLTAGEDQIRDHVLPAFPRRLVSVITGQKWRDDRLDQELPEHRQQEYAGQRSQRQLPDVFVVHHNWQIYRNATAQSL